MKSANKRVAIFFGVILICLIISTSCLVVCQLGHDCIGENCSVCCVIETATKLLSGALLFAVACALVVALSSFSFKRFLSVFKQFFNFTLISLKTKLSN